LFFCSGDGGEDGDSNAGDQEPPEPSELIEALQELENSASSDAVVRYGIFWESLFTSKHMQDAIRKIVLTSDWVI
jgi:hypothetical protein